MNNKALVVIDLQNDITKNYKEIIDRVWQRQDIPSMYCRTVLPATTKRSYRRCWNITLKRAVFCKR